MSPGLRCLSTTRRQIARGAFRTVRMMMNAEAAEFALEMTNIKRNANFAASPLPE